MSTFNGQMPEFPDIRVDFFRLAPGTRPPLACFLSHAHSDHLAGLESLKAPFVYCSSATRQMVLRLERYPHRVNFQMGILEARKQHYKHLKNLLKPMPLDTPTEIELAPGNVIQVTLFDANHCTGAVLFLIEGGGKAVLYTGDIRSEPWFVNSLVRNPCLIEYTSGLKTLECIYLDTSFTEDIPFPTKADGITELIRKVQAYPPDTKFHFAAWTFGYEEVWIALSKALRSLIHVDEYKMRLYKSLLPDFDKGESGPGTLFVAREVPALVGYKCGNTQQGGCLTLEQNVRLHSCDKSSNCAGIDDKIVWIRPIIYRSRSGQEINEIGIGGGAGDLTQRPEIELDSGATIQALIELFGATQPCVIAGLRSFLSRNFHSRGQALSLDDMGLNRKENDMPLQELAKVIAQVADRRSDAVPKKSSIESAKREDVGGIPKVITFPYSRHSSYEELCHLVEIFRPRDVYPCTVDGDNWDEGTSIEAQFGRYCRGSLFRHDEEMRDMNREHLDETQITQMTSSFRGSQDSDFIDDSTKSGLPDLAIGLRLSSTSTGSAVLSHFAASNSRISTTHGFDIEIIDIIDISSNSDMDPPAVGDASSSSASMAAGLRRKSHVSELVSRASKRPRLGRVERAPTIEAFHAYNRIGEDPHSVFDQDDEIFRCKKCGWEMWNEIGTCSSCGVGEDKYLEDDSSGSPHESDKAVQTIPSTGAVHDEDHSSLAEGYLDDDESAYDSLDMDGGHNEEYEKNSFIDDNASIHSAETDSENSESDYRVRFEELTKKNTALQSHYGSVAANFKEFRMYVMGSDYESDSCFDGHHANDAPSDQDSSNDDDLDEDGIFDIVDIEVRDPAVLECIATQSQEVIEVGQKTQNEESRASLLSADRIARRQEVFDAIISDEWPSVSLMSTGDNHTNIEMEL